MKEYVRLPETEFEIMQAVWDEPSPVSSMQIASVVGPVKGWKPQTILTMLTRLTNKGVLSSEKRGKERYYTPLITREEYLTGETGYFMERFHKNSLVGLISALYSNANPNEKDLNELEQWLQDAAAKGGNHND